MSKKLLLVDYENVQQVDLTRLDDGFEVIIFVGATQKSVPIELVTQAQRLGQRVDWQRVDGVGSNALDFHIACHLGRIMERSPQQQCLVLSKDKGFDPLLRYLNKEGLKCRRLNSLLELDPKTAPPTEDANTKRVIELLGKTDKKGRPRKLKTLNQTVAAFFQKKIPAEEVSRIIDTMFANKLISETNGNVSYEF
jgi:hypothetical protein